MCPCYAIKIPPWEINKIAFSPFEAAWKIESFNTMALLLVCTTFQVPPPQLISPFRNAHFAWINSCLEMSITRHFPMSDSSSCTHAVFVCVFCIARQQHHAKKLMPCDLSPLGAGRFVCVDCQLKFPLSPMTCSICIHDRKVRIPAVPLHQPGSTSTSFFL